MSQVMKPLQHNVPKQLYHIEGMHCGSCVARIEEGLKRTFPQLSDVRVNLATGQALLEGAVEPKLVIDAVDELGYQAKWLPKDVETPRPVLEKIVDTSETAPTPEATQAKLRLIAAVMLTVPLFIMHMGGFHFAGNAWAQWALATPVLFYSGQDIFKTAFKLLKRFESNMDTLIALGAGIAWLYSTMVLVSGDTWFQSMGQQAGMTQPHYYFETGAMIVTLILLGRYLEARARQRAGKSIEALMRLQPDTALLMQDGRIVEVPVEQVPVDASVMVRPGRRIPFDGIVLEGEGSVNESMMTGESLPVSKKPNDEVMGGTLNESGNLVIRVTHTAGNSVLAHMIDLVETAQTGKPPIQRLADKIAGIFVPIVLGLAALTFAGWLIAGHSVVIGISAVIAVLVIACPCALGLATPTAIQVGLGRSANEGILIRNTEGLELAHKLNILVFDKTGTLTQGQPQVVAFELLTGQKEADCIRWAAALESRSEHPLAKAVLSYAQELGVDWSQVSVESFTDKLGAGVVGRVEGRTVVIGKPSFLVDHKVVVAPLFHKLSHASQKGQTAIVLGINGQLAGAFLIADPLRPEAADAIRRLRHLHIRPMMLSGDRQETAQFIGEQAGLHANEIKGNVSPVDKLECLKDLQREGDTENRRIVGMVGDGINDAPALAQADVSIAIGTGTDIAMQTAQMTLVYGDISKAVDAILLSRTIFKVIRQNLFWAFFYNVVAIPAAALGYLNPMIAAAAMSLSSITVVFNSLRLRRAKLG